MPGILIGLTPIYSACVLNGSCLFPHISYLCICAHANQPIWCVLKAVFDWCMTLCSIGGVGAGHPQCQPKFFNMDVDEEENMSE